MIGVKCMWKNIRVACLLLVLLIVAVNAYRDQNQDWNQPINILLHPINADGYPLPKNISSNCSWMISMKSNIIWKKIASNIEGKAVTL